MNGKRRTRGLSLIELLVVMVILVVGIFTIGRVFPQGFRFITHARNVTLASRLSEAEVERWKAYAENVPDGIEAEDASTGGIWTDYNPNDMANANPNDPRQWDHDEDIWYWSNVNRVRLVRGETTKIPTATVLPYGTGGNYAFSIYNLKFAPVEFASEGGANHKLPPGYEWPDQYVLIYGDPAPRYDVTGLAGDERETALQNLNGPTYGIDYDSGHLYFHPTYWDRKYRVEYAWWDGGILRNVTEVITVPAAASWGSQLPETATDVALSHKGLDSYSDRVARKFQFVTPGNFDPHNPYQFTLLNTYSHGAAALSFSPTIGFNPIGENRTVRTNLGPRPLIAHIDYEVVDWHIIHEDRTVPNPATADPNGYALRLTLPGIKVAHRRYNGLSAVYADQHAPVNTPVYTGLMNTLDGYSVVGLDMTDNTLMLDEPGGLQVDYRNAIVTVPAQVKKYTPFGGELTQDIRGHDVRIFYQATGDWAVQVTKAWSSYQRSDQPAGPNGWQNLQYNTFSAHIVAPGQGVSGLPGYANQSNDWVAVLVFPRSNAGQSIAVSFQWTDSDGVTHDVNGRQYKLPEFNTLANNAYPFIEVPMGPNFTYNSNPNESWKNPNFTFVQGATLKVRTIWRESPRRWEVRDLETFLNRK